MSRESVARCPLTGTELSLLAVARLLPGRALLELRAAAGVAGDPVRRLARHVAAAEACAQAALAGVPRCCRRGQPLIARCHGWRKRPSGATA